MAWIGPDDSYTFTIARLLEGQLIIDNLTVTAGARVWTMIVGGVEQAITPAVHPGDTVKLTMIGKNLGKTPDNFVFTCKVGTGTPEFSPTFSNIAVNAYTTAWNTAQFVMPDANVDIVVQSFHEE